MTTRTASIALTLLLVSACGGSQEDAAVAASNSSATVGSPDPAAAWAGDYVGESVLTHGRFTWTVPVVVKVENPYQGIVRVPVREMCPSVDHVEFAPPEALVIVLTRPGDWSFALPTGEHVRLGSVHPRFDPDGKTLQIAFHGVVDGKDLEWSFVGTR